MRIPHRHLSRREAERLLDDPAGHGSALGKVLAAAGGPAQPGELGREDSTAATFQRTATVPSPGGGTFVVPAPRRGARAAVRAVVATGAVVALATGGFALAGSADLPHIPGLPGQASDRATESSSAAKDPKPSEASSTSATPGDEASETGTSDPGRANPGRAGRARRSPRPRPRARRRPRPRRGPRARRRPVREHVPDHRHYPQPELRGPLPGVPGDGPLGQRVVARQRRLRRARRRGRRRRAGRGVLRRPDRPADHEADADVETDRQAHRKQSPPTSPLASPPTSRLASRPDTDTDAQHPDVEADGPAHRKAHRQAHRQANWQAEHAARQADGPAVTDRRGRRHDTLTVRLLMRPERPRSAGPQPSPPYSSPPTEYGDLSPHHTATGTGPQRTAAARLPPGAVPLPFPHTSRLGSAAWPRRCPPRRTPIVGCSVPATRWTAATPSPSTYPRWQRSRTCRRPSSAGSSRTSTARRRTATSSAAGWSAR